MAASNDSDSRHNPPPVFRPANTPGAPPPVYRANAAAPPANTPVIQPSAAPPYVQTPRMVETPVIIVEMARAAEPFVRCDVEVRLTASLPPVEIEK
jgi:hypothetical protein